MDTAAAAIAFAQATKELVKFARYARSLADIPDDYRDFVKEVEDVSDLAGKVGELISDQETLDRQTLEKLKNDLEDIVGSLQQLSDDVKRRSKGRSSKSSASTAKISTIRWERKKTEITKLRESVRRTRDNLVPHLQILTVKHNRQCASDTREMLVAQLDGQATLTHEVIDRFSSLQVSVEATARLVSEVHGAVSDLVPKEPIHANPGTGLYMTPASLGDEQYSDIHGPLPGPLELRCDPYCPCHCHRTGTSNPFSWVEPILGKLVVRSNISFLFQKPPCNYPRCRSPSFSAAIHYALPRWLMRRDVQLRMSWGCLSGAGANLHLRVPRVVGSRIFLVMESGQRVLLERLLSTEKLSAADTNPVGVSVIAYALKIGPSIQILSTLLNAGFDTSISHSLGCSGITIGRTLLRLRSRGLFRRLADKDRDDKYQMISTRIAYSEAALATVPVRLSKIHRLLFTGNDANLAVALQDCLQTELDVCDECNLAPIHYAVLQDRPNALRLLLEAGADPNMDSPEGTPLTLAANANRSPVLLWQLLAYEADPNKPNSSGETAILFTLGQPSKVRMLLLAKAYAISRQWRMETPLHNWSPLNVRGVITSGEEQMKESIEMLLDAGIDIDHKDRYGCTPLMRAIGRCDVEAIRVLLRLGARTDVEDAYKWNLLHFAARYRGLPIIHALKCADFSNVDPHQRDIYGRRPYDMENAEPPRHLDIKILSWELFVVFCYAIGWRQRHRIPRWSSAVRHGTWYYHQQRRQHRRKESDRGPRC